MTYAAHHGEILPSCNPKPAARSGGAKRRGIWRRMFDAVYESRRRHADREIAAFIERSGGRMTDNIEFQISQRLMTGDWNGWR
ncbi:MAG TPA: hypothetical protein VH249_12215 [Xanthobacteraceae bacterium]|jgi:hypothetical protein|nr:hypothetical protein [Xanthobacteraceae bacterium]